MAYLSLLAFVAMNTACPLSKRKHRGRFNLCRRVTPLPKIVWANGVDEFIGARALVGNGGRGGAEHGYFTCAPWAYRKLSRSVLNPKPPNCDAIWSPLPGVNAYMATHQDRMPLEL